jgi:two-component system, NarL family, sensor histidine kinase DegS
MTNSAKLRFKKTYRDALRIHLKRKLNGRMTSHAARSVGSEGVSLGMNAVDLARTHEQVLGSLDVPSNEGFKLIMKSPLSAAGKFLLEALTPFEQSHQDEILKVRTSLFVAEEKLEQEIKSHRGEIINSQEIHEQTKQLARQFLLALEEERKEISRELHDQVAQVLAGINVRLAALKAEAAIDHENLGDRISQTQLLVEQSVDAVHTYARKLRPVMLDDLGLIPSLRSFIRELPSHEGLRIRFRAIPEVEELNNLKRTIIFRVAQEAVTNVLRHAKAKKLAIKLSKIDTNVLLEVTNDGKSFNVDRILNSNVKNRLGLLGMRERVEMVDGVFSITSSATKGTVVRALIPIGDQPAEQTLSE